MDLGGAVLSFIHTFYIGPSMPKSPYPTSTVEYSTAIMGLDATP